MKIEFLLSLFLIQFVGLSLYAQDGPGGIGTTDGNSNLQLWLKADDLKSELADGDLVFQWKDKSGAGNDVFGASVTAPKLNYEVTPGNAGVVFDGEQYLATLSASSSFNNPEATIFLIKAGEFSGASISLAENGWVNEMLMFDYDQFHHSSSGNFERLSHQCLEDISDDELTVIVSAFGAEPSDIDYYVNGVKSTQSIESAGFSWNYEAVDRKVTIGQRDAFVSSEFFEGALTEVVIYNTKLSDSEIVSVEEYLKCGVDIQPAFCSELSSEPCVTSTQVIYDHAGISLIPNPARDYISINLDAELLSITTEFNIYDQLGRQIKNGHLTEGNSDINISSLSNGVYFFKLEWSNGIATEKFVVQN